MFRRVLYPIDGAAASHRAAETLADILSPCGASVTLVTERVICKVNLPVLVIPSHREHGHGAK